MTLDPDAHADYLRRRVPLLWHVSGADAVEAILIEGLRPGSELHISSKGGFFKTRERHVYLGNLLSLTLVPIQGPRAYLRVDLSKLNPDLIDPDEDQVQDSFSLGGQGWVAVPPPVLPEGTDPEHADQSLAKWAETTDGFDHPEVTAKSLESGRISYRGTIPPCAIKVVTFLSEGPQLFHQGVHQALEGLNLDHAPPPELGFYKTEVARALALARTIIRRAAESVGEPADPLLPKWPQSEHATNTCNLLVKAARDRARRGDLAAAEVLRAAVRLSRAVPQLQPHLGWSPTRDACVNVALAGVHVITCLQEHVGEEAATSAARAAMEAVAAVPDQH